MQLDLPGLGRSSVLTGADRVDAYLRVLHALMLRDMRTRFMGSYWGYLVQVLWPVVHMFIIAIAMTFRGIPAPIGDSTMVFAASGAVPVLAFQYISREMMKGIAMNKPLTYYPQVRALDVMFSRVIVEIVNSFMGIMLILSILLAMGLSPIPSDIPTALCGYLCGILLGIGVGSINVAIVQIFPAWIMGYMLITILLYMASGVMFLAHELPDQIYSIMKWNPLVQIVEWTRLGFDPSLPVKLDYPYLFMWIFGTLAFGLMLERTVSRNGGT